MNTSISTKRNLKPLEIILGIFCIVWTLWHLFCLINNLQGFSKPGELFINVITGSFSTALSVFLYVFYLLLIIWFILMKDQLNNSARTLAIIGLVIFVVFKILHSNKVISFFHPSIYYFYFLDVVCIIGTILIGVAFCQMNSSSSQNFGQWAMIIGLLFLVEALFIFFSEILAFVLPMFLDYPQQQRVNLIVYLVRALIWAISKVAMAVLFFSIPKTRD